MKNSLLYLCTHSMCASNCFQPRLNYSSSGGNVSQRKKLNSLFTISPGNLIIADVCVSVARTSMCQ